MKNRLNRCFAATVLGALFSPFAYWLLFLDPCFQRSNGPCVHRSHSRSFNQSLKHVSPLLEDFLNRSSAFGIPLTILDPKWLRCIDVFHGVCKDLRLKRRFLFGSEAYEAFAQNISYIKRPTWNVSISGATITVLIRNFQVGIVDVLQRRHYWLIPAVKELGTPAFALRRQYSPAKFNAATNLHIYYPSPLKTFLSELKEGEFIECRREMAAVLREQYASRNSSTPVINDSVIEDLAYFRDLLMDLDITPFLFGGTLLGWYRECGIIPHTTDLDVAAFISTYKASVVDVLSKDQRLRLYWVLGAPNDSLELSVYANSTKLDLFFMYNSGNSSWVGGMIPYKREKLRWTYPAITSLCRAELLNELFSVPCNVEEVLIADYGRNWSHIEDAEFIWYKSHRNVQSVGTYNDLEWKRVYKVY